MFVRWAHNNLSKNRSLSKFCVLFLVGTLIFLMGSVSAIEIPTVGQHDDTWGYVLNTHLNVSLDEDNGELRNDTVSTNQIVDGSIVEADISDSINFTLGQKISFAFGEVIDNIVNGWVRITGGLNVTGDTVIAGDLNVVGNVTFNGVSLSNLTFNSIVGYTVSSYDGNISNGSLNGYSAANAICNAEYSGSHFCLKSEVLKTIANGNYSFTDTAWFANGPPGYTANADDCSGWTIDSNTYLGPFWNWDANSQAGRGALTNCAQAKQLMCCGGSS